MQIKTAVSTTVTETRAIELDEKKVRELLIASGIDIPIEAEVSVWFSIPGGGDWSNTNIDVTNHFPINVSWTVTKTSRDNE